MARLFLVTYVLTYDSCDFWMDGILQEAWGDLWVMGDFQLMREFGMTRDSGSSRVLCLFFIIYIGLRINMIGILG